jgi:UDP-4-amino-4,6-dideoxy-N-acetyl-beta-L-altrosamine N-acetyltransferase
MIAFVPLHEDALEQVLRWRTSAEVTRHLFTDIPFDMEKQRQWFARVSADPTCCHWLIRWRDRDVGLAHLAAIDDQAQHCNCGFYLGESDAGRIGGAILPGIINHVFGEMGYRKIWGEVMAGNAQVRQMHEVLGYREVGILTDHVHKNGQWHDVHVFEMMRDDWKERAALFAPYRIPFLERPGA